MPDQTRWRCPQCGAVKVMDQRPEACEGYPETHEPADFENLTELARELTDSAFRSAATIEQTKISWLWKPYLPLGHVTLLGGDGGVGKSTLTARIAATVTSGNPFPNGWLPLAGQPSSVLIMNAEDDLSPVLVPRLAASGADLDRVTVVDLSMADHLATLDERTFEDLDRNMALLKPRLVVVDPIVSFMGDQRDMNRANEIRPMIRRLGTLAARHRAAVLVVGHLNKNESASASNRLSGSVDFRNAARSLILAGKVDGEPDRGLAVFHDKSNYARLAEPLGYDFAQDEEDEDGVAAVRWLPATDLTAAEVFQGKAPKTPRTRTATEVIRAILRDLPERTSSGDWVTGVLKAALPGISAGTVQKARDAAPVAIVRHPDGTTDWRLVEMPSLTAVGV